MLLFFGATFFFWAALYIFVPFLPVYAESIPGGNISAIGIMLGSYSVALILLRVPLGIWSDNLGRRKPFIAIGFGAIIFGAMGLALSPNIWFLTAARLITGIGAAVWVAFTVLFASYFAEEKTPQAMGALAFVMGLSQVIAAYSGGYLAENFGIKSVFYLAAVLAFLGLFCVLKVVETPSVPNKKTYLASLGILFANPLLVRVSAAGALVMLIVFTASLGFLPIYANNLYASKAELGLLSMAMFASYTLASLLIALLTSRWSLRPFMITGVFLLTIGSLIVPWLKEVHYLFLPQILMGLGWGLAGSLLMGLSIRDIASSEKATAMGIFQAIYGIGMLLGPFMAGMFAKMWGIEYAFFSSAFFGFVCMGLLLKIPKK